MRAYCLRSKESDQNQERSDEWALSKKTSILKRIANSAYRAQGQVLRQMRACCLRSKELQLRESNICKRIANSALNQCAQALRQLKHFNDTQKVDEEARQNKMKGICARLSNSSTNIMGKAMNNLISFVKSHNARIRENVKLIIRS